MNKTIEIRFVQQNRMPIMIQSSLINKTTAKRNFFWCFVLLIIKSEWSDSSVFIFSWNIFCNIKNLENSTQLITVYLTSFDNPNLKTSLRYYTYRRDASVRGALVS